MFPCDVFVAGDVAEKMATDAAAENLRQRVHDAAAEQITQLLKLDIYIHLTNSATL